MSGCTNHNSMGRQAVQWIHTAHIKEDYLGAYSGWNWDTPYCGTLGLSFPDHYLTKGPGKEPSNSASYVLPSAYSSTFSDSSSKYTGSSITDNKDIVMQDTEYSGIGIPYSSARSPAQGTELFKDKDVKQAFRDGADEGQIMGILNERKEWEAAGHGLWCFDTKTDCFSCNIGLPEGHTCTANKLNAMVQVDSVEARPPSLDAAIQVSPSHHTSSSQTTPPLLVNVEAQAQLMDLPPAATTAPTLDPPAFDWSDDTTSIPIVPIFPKNQPCRFSVLTTILATLSPTILPHLTNYSLSTPLSSLEPHHTAIAINPIEDSYTRFGIRSTPLGFESSFEGTWLAAGDGDVTLWEGGRWNRDSLLHQHVRFFGPDHHFGHVEPHHSSPSHKLLLVNASFQSKIQIECGTCVLRDVCSLNDWSKLIDSAKPYQFTQETLLSSENLRLSKLGLKSKMSYFLYFSLSKYKYNTTEKYLDHSYTCITIFGCPPWTLNTLSNVITTSVDIV
ncbi:uncharacterized protein LACBIDRAFT_334658 [Laccaria bicolor S238N-H82]|uniref:Predicted protein n=1 Tax=Laccaria bicolor (strain S238N-H82 / ATCC MYA-4686) TaxID=486041 RepID=B0DZV8_LACBS|nr:uncharacterized protein LACBIDRAFT_334658 [Laccaria bicolor S238N-H82]EDQ99906.1 predicted protein [Laccaria bicolor S238N-H82]|eukprot:XP_001889449.1 predicted protein [Laccaria bicolor S238N-H82]